MPELASHPDVLEVSVVGREHPTWGERPMAYVILHKESALHWAGKHAEFSSALKAHARGRLPGFATPEWVVVVEELPVRPFIAHVFVVVLKPVITPENIHRKNHEDGLAQASCFRKIINIYLCCIQSRVACTILIIMGVPRRAPWVAIASAAIHVERWSAGQIIRTTCRI